jgi:hypothetical protein
MVGRQRLALVDIEGCVQLLLSQRGEKIAFHHDGAARGIDQDRAGLHQRQLFRAHQPARALAEHEVDGHDVRSLEKMFFTYFLDSRLRRFLLRQVLAPGHAVHAEGLADRRDARADVAQPEQAEGFSCQREAGREAFVPSARSHVALAFGESPCRRDDQAPRQLDGGEPATGGARIAHRDAALLEGLRVEARRARAGEADELEIRKLLDQRAPEGGALAHQADRVERF